MATITISPLTSPLPRDELARFLPTPRAVRAFEGMQTDVAETLPEAIQRIVDLTNALLTAPYITWAEAPTLENERTLAVTSTLRLTNDGTRAILGLAETGIAAGSYGSASQTLAIQADLFGRLTGVQAYDLLSDNVAEGTSHLYFTTERARTALSGTAGIGYDSATGVITLEDAPVTPGTYGSATAVPVLDIDQKGRVTGASTIAIPTLASGTYTPTLTGVVNVSSLTSYGAQYSRNGSVVTVSGSLSVVASSAANVLIDVSLPVPSNIGSTWHLSGVASSYAGAIVSAGIYGNAAGKTARISYDSPNTAARDLTYTFTYRVI